MTIGGTFADHFSGVAGGYAVHRPRYPAGLFDTLMALAPTRDLVWDCAAGNGQASVPLGDRFANVIATDASAAQLAKATSHPRVHYCTALATASPMRHASVSLITVGQALHWFDFDAFYAEAKRVLVPGGVLAVWVYGLIEVSANVAVEQLIGDFALRRLQDWWPPERRYVDDAYRSIRFPFAPLELPAFEMTVNWTQAQLLGFLRTWSAVSRKRAAEGVDPVLDVEGELARVWGKREVLPIRWPLTVVAGRNA